MLKTYEKLTTEQQTIALQINYEAYFFDDIQEENKRRMKTLMQKLVEFEEKWLLQSGNIRWETDRNGVISFEIDETTYTESEIVMIIEKYDKLFDTEKIQEEINEYMDVTNYQFEVWVEIYNDELDVYFYNEWILTNYLTHNPLLQRLEKIDKITNEKVIAKRKEQKMKTMFGNETTNEEIDEVMKIIKEEKVYDFPWIRKINELIKTDFNAFRDDILTELCYLRSDEFQEDIIKKKLYEYNDKLEITEKGDIR